jgi:L-lysine exporter family protein LysE/ArgO
VRAFSSGFLLCLPLCFDIGMVNVATMRTALRQGGGAGFLLSVGACGGDMVYFSLAAFGSTALLGWTPFRFALWILGTAALAWMVWRTLGEVARPRHLDLDAAGAERQAPAALLLTGAGLALASPTAILWFAAVGGSVIASFGGDRIVLLPFAAGFLAAGILWAMVFPFSVAWLRQALGDWLVRALSAISAALFLYFAALVFTNGLKQFVR